MEKIGFCMLASTDGEEIRSRPMAAYVRRDEGAILFLTDADSDKEDEIEARPNVNLAFRLLSVEPKDAQYWDSPGKLRAYIRMAAAAVSDTRPAMGEHAKVEM